MYKLENGQSLSKWCLENKVPYDCIWRRIVYEKMSIDDAIKNYKASVTQPKHCKFRYKGKTLRQYCFENGLKYQYIIDCMRTCDYTIEEAINRVHKNFLTNRK